MNTSTHKSDPTHVNEWQDCCDICGDNVGQDSLNCNDEGQGMCDECFAREIEE